jgi:hypothetical protein
LISTWATTTTKKRRSLFPFLSVEYLLPKGIKDLKERAEEGRHAWKDRGGDKRGKGARKEKMKDGIKQGKREGTLRKSDPPL